MGCVREARARRSTIAHLQSTLACQAQKSPRRLALSGVAGAESDPEAGAGCGLSPGSDTATPEPHRGEHLVRAGVTCMSQTQRGSTLACNRHLRVTPGGATPGDALAAQHPRGGHAYHRCVEPRPPLISAVDDVVDALAMILNLSLIHI